MAQAEVKTRHHQLIPQPNNWITLAPDKSNPVTAYFCMEYGVDPHLPIYSGGLGMLAGDHLKAANDLNIRLAAIGLYYHHGYFRQKISEDGWQMEEYPLVDPKAAGVNLLVDQRKHPVSVKVPIEDRNVHVWAYLKQVGNIPLILLTTNLRINAEEDRLITAHLYGGENKYEKQTRVRQETVLGVGGKRILDKLGFRVGVYHMNEGHSAFLTLARLEESYRKGVSIKDALKQVRANQIYTNHTPVPAGNDIFPEDVLEKELAYYQKLFGSGFTFLKDQANHLNSEPAGSWSQAKFAIASTQETTTVSRIHSEVMAAQWGKDKVAYVTNGVHVDWMDDEIRALIDPDRERFIQNHTNMAYLRPRISNIDPEDFLHTIGKKRRELTALANEYAGAAFFDPNILTIGFARRFATYKRLDLLFRNPDRLLKLLKDQTRPIQIIFAGKAHPHDDEGKMMIQRLVRLTQDPQFRQHAIFIPDYNSRIAMRMTNGADVWLNVPIKYHEASGTSGMKNGIRGGRQLSVDDGWMNEVPEHHYFKITEDPNQDIVAASIYFMLQETITKQFYTPEGKHQLDWATAALNSMEYIIAHFSAQRMVREYQERFYLPLTKVASSGIVLPDQKPQTTSALVY